MGMKSSRSDAATVGTTRSNAMERQYGPKERATDVGDVDFGPMRRSLGQDKTKSEVSYTLRQYLKQTVGDEPWRPGKDKAAKETPKQVRSLLASVNKTCLLMGTSLMHRSPMPSSQFYHTVPMYHVTALPTRRLR